MTSSSEWSVAKWLTSFGMKDLIPKFLEHGYETEKLCSNLLMEDMEAMCINNKMHLEVIFTQSEMLRKKREGSAAVANGQAPAFVRKPLEDTDGTSPNLQLRKQKVRKSPVVQHRKAAENLKLHGAPPESQRTFAGLTKLQLKLRIKEEIRKNHIVLSEAPYCREDGSANEGLLQQLAEEYAERFSLESLTVYYALKDVWRFTANERTEIATPMSGELKKDQCVFRVEVSKPTDGPLELCTYSEPFDNKVQSPVKPVGKPPKKVCGSGSGSPKNPPAPFQPIPEPLGTYADPFDAIPQISKDSPPSAELKRRNPIPSSPRPVNSSPGKSCDDSNIKSKVSPSPMNKIHSFTLPPPGSPSISSSSSEGSPKKSPRSRRFWSPFRKRKNASSSASQSPQHMDLSQPRAVVHGSMEDLPQDKSPSRMRQSASQNRILRQSLPGAFSHLPHVATAPGLLYDSASEDSPIPAKKLSGSCGMLIDSGQHTPLDNGAGISPTGSFSDERVVSRVKALAIKRSNSDFELSNVVELYIEGQDKPFRFKKAQSTDELDKEESSTEDVSGKKKKTSNILSRLFKPKSRKDRLKAAAKKSKTQSVSDDLITPSRSMPNVSRAIAAVIHSEYTEVFDDHVRGRVAKTPSPSPSPRVPQRNRPHTTKPQRTTSTQSPKTSPPTHHRLMVKSDSIGSSEMTIHSIPTSKEDNDATIELRLPGAVCGACDSQVGLEEEGEFGDVFRSSDVEKSPERDSSQTSTNSSCGTVAKEDQPIPMVRTPSGSKPPLAPKPVISRERVTSGSSLKRVSRTSVESSASPSPSHSLTPMEGQSDRSKPPPKPSRNKSKSVNRLSPASMDGRSGEETHEVNLSQLPHFSAIAARETATPLAGVKTLNVADELRRRWPSGSNPPPKPPKPLGLRGSTSLPLHLKMDISSAVLDSVEKKLAEEGIDLSQSPYTNQLGEYNIPSALVSRYGDEMDCSADDIALSLEDIRRRLLSKLSRKYVPFVGSWKNHSSLDRSSVEAFLTSVGLPIYCAVFEEHGYSSIELIQSASSDQMYILPLTDRHRQLLSKAVLSL